MKEKLVSIIIPVYNREKKVKKAIKSCLNQTYRNIEIIVIDDCSTDNTLKELKKIKNKKIKIISNYRKKGPAGARNSGILMASGEYIAFLDSDDEWFKEHLSDSLSVLENENIDLIFGRAKYYKKNFEIEFMGPNLIKKINLFKLKTIKQKYIIFDESMFEHLLKHGCFFNLSSVVIKRRIIDEGYLMNENLLCRNDSEYWQRISRFFTFGYVKPFQIIYNIGNDNISIGNSKDVYEKNFIQTLKFYNIISGYKYLNNNHKKLLKINYSKHYFDYGYYNKNIGNLEKARLYYMKSLKTKFNILALKAYVKTFMIK